jgi:hypothetical protein
MTRRMLVALLLPAMFLLASSPARAATATTIPFMRVFAMVADAHGHVFVSGGPSTPGIAVFDDSGALLEMIDVPGSSGMALIGDELFAAAADVPSIEVVDTIDLSIERSISVDPFTQPQDLTVAEGSLWFLATHGGRTNLVSVAPDGTGLS